ncbi:MAG: alpha/beta fold hydrolase [Bacteroidota bacterium]
MTLASGQEICYYESGSKDAPTLFLIHGMGNYAQVWFKLMRSLGQHFHCLSLDLPGHGGSPVRPVEESIADFASVVEEFVLAFSPRDYVLAGHSMGGQVVLQTCLNEHLSPRSIVLLAPAGFEEFTDHDFAWLNSIYRGGIIAKLGKSRMVQQFRDSFHTFPEDADFMLKDVTHLRDSAQYLTYCNTLSRCARAVFASSVYHELERVTTPALVYYGQADAMVPHRVLHKDQNLAELCAAATQRMAQAQLHLLPATGHMLQWEAATEISRGMESFLL